MDQNGIQEKDQAETKKDQAQKKGKKTGTRAIFVPDRVLKRADDDENSYSEEKEAAAQVCSISLS